MQTQVLISLPKPSYPCIHASKQAAQETPFASPRLPPPTPSSYHQLTHTLSLTITRAPRRPHLPLLLLDIHDVVARQERELGPLQRGPQVRVARVDELEGFQLGFVADAVRRGKKVSGRETGGEGRGGRLAGFWGVGGFLGWMEIGYVWMDG